MVKKKPWFTKRKRKSTRKVPTSLIKRIDTVSISRIPYAEKNPRNSKGTLWFILSVKCNFWPLKLSFLLFFRVRTNQCIWILSSIVSYLHEIEKKSKIFTPHLTRRLKIFSLMVFGLLFPWLLKNAVNLSFQQLIKKNKRTWESKVLRLSELNWLKNWCLSNVSRVRNYIGHFFFMIFSLALAKAFLEEWQIDFYLASLKTFLASGYNY